MTDAERLLELNRQLQAAAYAATQRANERIALEAARDDAYAKGRADMLRDVETWLDLRHPIVAADLHDAFTPRTWEKGTR